MLGGITLRLIITDTDASFLKTNSEDMVITNNDKIHNCIGCFGCWIKTPGKCVITDGFEEMGKYLSKCSELILVSKCTYGSASPFVKNVLDRAISYIHPDFTIRNGEMHHKRRYSNKIKLSAYYYGEDIHPEEKETARRLIQANVINYDGEVGKLAFFQSLEELRGVIL